MNSINIQEYLCDQVSFIVYQQILGTTLHIMQKIVPKLRKIGIFSKMLFLISTSHTIRFIIKNILLMYKGEPLKFE